MAVALKNQHGELASDVFIHLLFSHDRAWCYYYFFQQILLRIRILFYYLNYTYTIFKVFFLSICKQNFNFIVSYYITKFTLFKSFSWLGLLLEIQFHWILLFIVLDLVLSYWITKFTLSTNSLDILNFVFLLDFRRTLKRTKKFWKDVQIVDNKGRAVFISWLPVNRGRDINISCEVKRINGLFYPCNICKFSVIVDIFHL